jgi:hypothetical protein
VHPRQYTVFPTFTFQYLVQGSVAVGPLVMNIQASMVLNNGYAGPNILLLDYSCFFEKICYHATFYFQLFEKHVTKMQCKAPFQL